MWKIVQIGQIFATNVSFSKSNYESILTTWATQNITSSTGAIDFGNSTSGVVGGAAIAALAAMGISVSDNGGTTSNTKIRITHRLDAVRTSGRFRYLLLKGNNVSALNIRQIQVWVNNQNVASVNNGASPAEFRGGASGVDEYTSQDVPAWTTPDGTTYWAYYTNNDSITTPNNTLGCHSEGPWALNPSNVGLYIDLNSTYDLGDLQAIVVYNRLVGISENGVSFGGEEGGLRIKDFKPQLLDENQEVIFDGDYFSSSDVYHHHRVNGPAWDSMLSSLKTTNESNFANAIIDKTSYDYNSIFSYDQLELLLSILQLITAVGLRTESNAIDLSSTYDISGLTGTAPHTIIATFNINATAVNLHHVIVGYGTSSYHGDKFALRVSSHGSFGGDASGGVYVLGLWCGGGPDFWLDSNIGTISTGVETTAAVSWDGMNTYLFLKNSNTGQWVMDSNANQEQIQELPTDL